MSIVMQEQGITLSEAQRRLGVSEKTLRRLIGTGRLTVVEVPLAHPKVLAHEVDELLKSSTRPRRAG